MKKIFRFDKSLFNVTTSIGTVNFFSLAFPIFFETVMVYMLGTVHTALLSSYSENSVAAVGTAGSVISMFSLFFSIIATGATVVISNHIGAERIDDAQETSFSAILLSTVFAIILIPIINIFGKNIISMLNLKNNTAAEALIYLKIRMSFIIFQAISGVYLSILRCYGYPKYTIVANTISNIINILISIIVIYFPEYSPIKGVAGLATASIIGQFASMIISIWYTCNLKIQIKKPKNTKKLCLHLAKIARIGIPSGISSASVSISQLINTSFVALIGDYALSAQVYFSTFASYVYLFSNSAGSANSLMIGRLCGAKKFNRANQTNKQLIRLTIPMNLAASLLILAFRYPLLSIFTTNKLILAMSVYILVIDIIAEQARAVSQVYEYSLRAAGDVLFSLISSIISCWVFSIFFSYILAIKCGFGLIGCWIGISCDESVRAISSYFRWRYLYSRKNFRT